MTIKIVRKQSADTGTPGHLTLLRDDGTVAYQCDTLELAWRDNHPMYSCILPDTYNATLEMSQRFGYRVVRLEDKHGRTDCLIHAGNWAGDVQKGLYSDVEGCTLVGSGYAAPETPKGVAQFGILASRYTLSVLMQLLSEPLTVTYSWGEGYDPTVAS